MSESSQCGVCRFWRSGATDLVETEIGIVEEEIQEFGYCYVNPPVPVKGLYGTDFVRPVTHENDFCSWFKENGEEK